MLRVLAQEAKVAIIFVFCEVEDGNVCSGLGMFLLLSWLCTILFGEGGNDGFGIKSCFLEGADSGLLEAFEVLLINTFIIRRKSFVVSNEFLKGSALSSAPRMFLAAVPTSFEFGIRA